MNLSHPSTLLQNDWIEIIRSNSSQAEKEKRLTHSQLDLIYNQDWHKLMLPQSYGGKQLSVPDALQLIEAFSWADASFGWIIAINTVSGWQSSFLDPTTARELLNEHNFILSSSRAESGTAELTEGGYIVNGAWPHASGSVDAKAVIGNCVLTKDGIPISQGDTRQTRSVIFLADEISILPTWKSMGMLASASDGFEVKNKFVPANRAFKTGENPRASGKLYHYPYMRMIEAGLGIIISGITLHFLDLCKQHFDTKTSPVGVLLADDRMVQSDLDRLTRKFDTARDKLFYGVSILWQAVAESKPLYPAVMNKVSSATSTLAQIARETVNELYPYLGLKVTETDTELNRVWRDFQTASQHSLLVFGG